MGTHRDNEVKGVCMVIRSLASRMILAVSREWQGSLHWTLPGGKVEMFERPETAVWREVYEETGYEVEHPFYLFDGMCPHPYEDQEWQTRCYIASTPHHGIPETEEDHLIGFVYPEQLGGPFKPFYDDLNDATGIWDRL